MERDTRRRRPEEPERRPAPQRRRRNKRSPLSNSMLYIVMVCAVSIVLAAVGWSLANDMLALNKDKVTATIVVDDENDFGSVVDQLKDNDIIKYKGLFRLFRRIGFGESAFRLGLLDGSFRLRVLRGKLSFGLAGSRFRLGFGHTFRGQCRNLICPSTRRLGGKREHQAKAQ